MGGGAPPPACPSDVGWGGVTGYPFAPFGGAADTHHATFFTVGRAAGANLDRVYVGVHVENDDRFTSSDAVALFFNPGAGGFAAGQSFALRIEVGPQTPPIDEDCGGTVNSLTYYPFNGTAWTPLYTFSGGMWTGTPPPVGSIVAKTSHDYNASPPDLETNIWELELELHPLELGITLPATGTLKVGAKLCLEESAGSILMTLPAALTTDGNPSDTDPNAGAVAVKATDLAAFAVGGCKADVVIDSITGTDAFGNAGKVTVYKPTDFPAPTPADPRQTLPASKRNHFTAQVRFSDPGVAGSPPLAVPNTGPVQFDIKGYGASPMNPHLMSAPIRSFTLANQMLTVGIDWPPDKVAYDDASADLQAAGHACVVLTLKGFTVNLNEPDVKQQNLTFSHLSTVKESFLIQAPKTEAAGGYTEYVIRPRWKNLPPKFLPPDPDKPVKGLWNYAFTNASVIGLKPIGHGYYLVSLKPGERKRVEVQLTGGDMPSHAVTMQLLPTAGGAVATPPSGGPPLSIPVKPGMMATVIANGLLTIDQGNSTSASASKSTTQGGGRHGVITPEGIRDPEMQKQAFLMSPKGAYLPWENVGALIGSFDKAFKTSFRIGSSGSFIAPAGATHLYFAVNDVAGSYKDNAGKGYELNVVLTDPVTLPTRLALAGDAGNGLPGRADPGANLPRLDIDALRLVRAHKALVPAGYVSYAVYHSTPD